MRGLITWDSVIDTIQNGMIFLLIVVVAVCIITLIAFDGVVGAGAMLYLTNGNVEASVGISLATSGLLMALMFIGYSLTLTKQNQLISTVGNAVLLFSGLVYLLDVYFDSLTADYLRFNKFVAIAELGTFNIKVTQVLFRILIGGLSTFGETLAVAIILGMPVLKNLVSDALPKARGSFERNQPKPNTYPPYPGKKFEPSNYKPKHRPNFPSKPDENKDEPRYHPTGMQNLLDEVMKNKGK